MAKSKSGPAKGPPRKKQKLDQQEQPDSELQSPSKAVEETTESRLSDEAADISNKKWCPQAITSRLPKDLDRRKTDIQPLPKNRPYVTSSASVDGATSRPSLIRNYEQQFTKRIVDKILSPAEYGDRPKFSQVNHGKIGEQPGKRSRISRENRGLDDDSAPLSNLDDIFDCIARKASDLNFETAAGKRVLRVVTMCSGTEAPILSLNLLKKAYERQGKFFFNFKHVASAEIEPFKQSFIYRNFGPLMILRDVTEFVAESDLKGVNPPKLHNCFGAVVSPPKNVHILVAGSACVDYSTLNPKLKKFGEQGQSFDTMSGIRAYAQEHRPNVIILENIRSAPWKEIRQYWLDAGYLTRVVSVDSKDYYIPQTRTRGYLVALDFSRAHQIDLWLPPQFGGDGTRSMTYNLVEKANRWAGLMQELHQRASAPFTDFLFANDDLYLKQVRKTADFGLSNTGQRQWNACRHRYAKYRAEKSYGVGKPMTKWQSNGTCKPPDFGWLNWFKALPERVLDSLDIELLRHTSERDYDINFKSRWLELSQNVDRDDDSRFWGIVSCLTPSGIPYLSTRGGPVTGMESLALQGIPVRELSFTTETSRQLQDLAGNGMTTTVVVCAMISAIIVAGTPDENGICFFSDFPDDTDVATGPETNALSLKQLLRDPKNISLLPTPLCLGAIRSDLEVSELKLLAIQTVQLCSREGSSHTMNVPLQICVECGHISCKKCGENPKHHYRHLPSSSRSAQLTASTFVEIITNILPRSLRLVGFGDSTLISKHMLHLASDPADKSIYKDAIENALSDVAYYQHAKVSNSWTITYEGRASRWELQFKRKCSLDLENIEDLLNSDLVDCYWVIFGTPDPDLRAGSEVRKFLDKYPLARMTPVGSILQGVWQFFDPQEPKLDVLITGEGKLIKSWENKLGLQSATFKNQYVPSELVVEVAGESNVSKSIRGTYKALQDCGAASGTLHRRMDNNPSALSTDPVFLFLDPEHLGNACFDHFVFSTDRYRPLLGRSRLCLGQLPPGWRPTSQNRDRPVELTVLASWVENTEAHAVSDNSGHSLWSCRELPKVLIENVLCQNTDSTLFVISVPIKDKLEKTWRPGTMVPVLLVNRPAALQEFAWLLKRVNIPDLETWQVIQFTGSNFQQCSRCAPKPPALRWTTSVTKNTKNKDVRTVLAVENEEEAQMLEEAEKRRPPPFHAQMHCQDGHALLQMSVNVVPLLHQTLAKLFRHQNFATGNVQASWRMCRDTRLDLPPIFMAPKEINNNADEAVLPSNPPANMSRSLWPSQMQALAWMLKQETKPEPWIENARAEVQLPVLDLRLDVDAKASRRVCGGILADHVGGGKTITSLALIGEMLAAETSTPPLFVPECELLPIKATLILVPENIIGQWLTEKNEFMNASVRILCIKSVQNLLQSTIEQFESADIILTSWNLLDHDGYWSAFASLSSACNMPKEAGRAFLHWLCKAISRLRNIIHLSGGCQKESFWEIWESLKDDMSPFADFKATTEHAERHEKEYTDELPVSNGVHKNGKIPPLLHLFSFRRIIVDEFTYVKGRSMLALLKLDARSRWLLSGTPPLADFDSINATAKLLGTSLVPEEEQEDCLTFVKKEAASNLNKKCASEQFRSFASIPSNELLKWRNSRANEFVEHFVRQNDRVELPPYNVQIKVNSLTASEQATYLEVQHRLADQSITFKPLTGKSNLVISGKARSELLDEVIVRSSCPEDALLSCCSDIRETTGSAVEIYEDRIREEADHCASKGKELLQAFIECFTVMETSPVQLGGIDDHFAVFQEHVFKNRVGDEYIAEVIDMILHAAYVAPRPTITKKKKTSQTTDVAQEEAEEVDNEDGNDDNAGEDKKKPETKDAKVKNEVKRRVGEMELTTTAMIEHARKLRLHQVIRCILLGEQLPVCSYCGQRTPSFKQTYIMGICGHVACASCFDDEDRQAENPDGCVEPGCNAAALQHQKFPASRFTEAEISSQTPQGSKMSAVIEQIKAIDDDERVLVFLQYERVKKHLEVALKEAGIEYTDAFGSGKLNRERVEKFQHGDSESGKVCILLIDSPDAAGWNLQAANHVMFISALVASNQYDYEATITQAIGRAHRPGQKKIVQVYHFLMARTIEVNIVEERNLDEEGRAKKLVKRDGVFALVGEEDVLATDEADWSGPALDSFVD